MTDHAHSHPAGRIAGIDFGTVRIGVAITDSARTLASPLECYTRRDRDAEAEYFRKLTAEHGLVQFVVGLPVHLAGHESAKSVEARAFGRWLAEVTARPVVYFDERFSSSEADQLLAVGKLTAKRRKERRDMLAAQIMLTAFLEAGQPQAAEPRGLDEA